MKSFLSALSILLVSTVATAASVEMPEWNDPKDASSFVLGGGLWPSGLIEEEGEDSEASAEGAGEKETATETASDAVARSDENESEDGQPGTDTSDLEFFGPAEGTEADPATPARSPDLSPETVAVARETGEGEGAEASEAEPLPPIEGELEDLYFAHAPFEFLVDPQRLLTEQKSNDIKRFLEFHSDESEYHIYVLVIGESQKIPDNVDLRQLHREWFAESPTVMMIYYREAPEMTEFVYNDSVTSALPSSVFERIRQNCLREGAATELAPDQVEKMAIELSIQLYWLSRLEEAETHEARTITAETPVHELPASEDAPELLREYAPGIFVEESGRRFVSIVLTALLILIALVIVAAIGWVLLWWRNRDRVSGAPLIFPSFQVVPRLGGEFSGGGFVAMSFEVNDSV